MRSGAPGADRAKVGRSSRDLPLQDSGNKVFRSSRHLGGRIANRVTVGSSMQSWHRAKSVIGEVRHRVGIQPGANSVYGGNRSRTAMVAHKELLRDLTVMIKAHNRTHGSKVDFKEADGVSAADITYYAQSLSGKSLLPVLKGEVDSRDLGVDVVEGIEAVVSLLMGLDGDGVADCWV